MKKYLILLSLSSLCITIYAQTPEENMQKALEQIIKKQQDEKNQKGVDAFKEMMKNQQENQSNEHPYVCSAIWEKKSVSELQMYDWKFSDYKALYDQLWSDGWRLHTLDIHVLNNTALYTTVWRKLNIGETQLYGSSFEGFKTKYDALWKEGWRLHILKNFWQNGKLLWTAIWRKEPSVSEKQSYNMDFADFKTSYDKLWQEGWRLHILTTVPKDGKLSYAAVWRKSTLAETQIYGASYDVYKKKYDGLWKDGWRLYILNNNLVNGQVQYTAVWRKSNIGETQVYEWKYQDYKTKYDALWKEGWRLKIIDVLEEKSNPLQNMMKESTNNTQQ